MELTSRINRDYTTVRPRMYRSVVRSQALRHRHRPRIDAKNVLALRSIRGILANVESSGRITWDIGRLAYGRRSCLPSRWFMWLLLRSVYRRRRRWVAVLSECARM